MKHGILCASVCQQKNILMRRPPVSVSTMIIQFSKENVLKLDTNRDDNGFVVVRISSIKS